MSNDILTDADAGSTRQVNAGEIVELRLEENPSTGYQWKVNVEPHDGATIAASAWLGLSGLGANQVIGGFGIHVVDITAQHSGRGCYADRERCARKRPGAERVGCAPIAIIA